MTSQISQAYEEVLTEYREMMQSIRRNEDISANLARELQTELLRMSEVSCQDDGLKDVYKCIQAKEEIMKFATDNLDSVDIPKIDRHSLKETMKHASNLLQEISEAAFKELDSDIDKITE